MAKVFWLNTSNNIVILWVRFILNIFHYICAKSILKLWQKYFPYFLNTFSIFSHEVWYHVSSVSVDASKVGSVGYEDEQFVNSYFTKASSLTSASLVCN